MENEITLPVDAGASYMPHGKPMVLVDKLLFVGDVSRVTAKLGSAMMFMGQDGTMDNVAYVELVAQAVALREGYLRVLEGRKVEGFLVGVRKFEMFRKAKAGDELHIEVKRLVEFGDELSIVSGTVFIGGDIVAQGEVKIWEKT